MLNTRRPREPRTARPWRWTLPLILAVFTAAACSTDPDSSSNAGPTSVGPTQPTAAPSPSEATRSEQTATSNATPRPSSSTTPINVTVGGRTYKAELYDNPTAHDLADQLPLTLTMDDLNGLEKTGPLPRALTTDGAPRGSDPEPNEIGYYSPGRDLVLYYGDVGYYNGIIRIGRFDTAIDTIADQPDGARVTIERAFGVVDNRAETEGATTVRTTQG